LVTAIGTEEINISSRVQVSVHGARRVIFWLLLNSFDLVHYAGREFYASFFTSLRAKKSEK